MSTPSGSGGAGSEWGQRKRRLAASRPNKAHPLFRDFVAAAAKGN